MKSWINLIIAQSVNSQFQEWTVRKFDQSEVMKSKHRDLIWEAIVKQGDQSIYQYLCSWLQHIDQSSIPECERIMLTEYPKCPAPKPHTQ